MRREFQQLHRMGEADALALRKMLAEFRIILVEMEKCVQIAVHVVLNRVADDAGAAQRVKLLHSGFHRLSG